MADNRAIGFWVIGTVCVFFGSLIAGSVEPSALGARIESVILAYIISFVLILVGGMFWISVSATMHEE